MDKKFLKDNNISESVNRFNTILEYVKLGGGLTEDAPVPPDDNEMGGAPDPSMAGGAPTMGGAPDPAMAGGDPSMGGAPDPAMAGGDPSMGGAPDPSMDGVDPSASGVEGFSPEEGVSQDGDAEPEEDEEVIDVDELVDSQEDTEKKISRMSKKFDKLIDALSNLEVRLDANSESMNNIEKEIEKRNPTPVEKLSLRSKMSGPYDQSVDDYWDEKEATSPNYSTEDDNNGADDEVYKITKSDIDDDVNWQEIEKTLNDPSMKPMGLKDILNF